jgi:hypothetical protein
MNDTIFGKDSTVRLSCRTGDYMLWCRFNGVFSPKNDQYSINDVWELSDSDFITITNRQVDLPSWFELHPTEVSGSLVYWMMKKLDLGYQPREIVNAPNIWRAFTGDRLVWVGKQRTGLEFDNGIISIFTLNQNAAIIGEPSDYERLSTFGGFNNEQSEENIKLVRNGWNAVASLETPRSANANGQWTLG